MFERQVFWFMCFSLNWVNAMDWPAASVALGAEAFLDELAEIRLLDSVEAATAVLARVLEQQSETLRSARGGADRRIKRGSPREVPASMHVELFSGLYSHLVAFLFERGRQGVDIEVRTDQVDTPLVKQFTEVADELLNEAPRVAKASAFDTQEKKVVTGSITTTVKYPPELNLSPQVSSLSIVTVPDSDGLVLAADVLANSLNYLFKTRSDADLYGALNCKSAIANHPLASHLDAFAEWGSGDCVGDGIYRHPKTNA